MKKVVIITTGGTIAMKRGPMVGGAVPLLKGDDFMALLPRGGVDLVFEELRGREVADELELGAERVLLRFGLVERLADVRRVRRRVARRPTPHSRRTHTRPGPTNLALTAKPRWTSDPENMHGRAARAGAPRA